MARSEKPKKPKKPKAKPEAKVEATSPPAPVVELPVVAAPEPEDGIEIVIEVEDDLPPSSTVHVEPEPAIVAAVPVTQTVTLEAHSPTVPPLAPRPAPIARHTRPQGPVRVPSRAPEVPSIRDAACAAQGSHQARCGCTGDARKPIRA